MKQTFITNDILLDYSTPSSGTGGKGGMLVAQQVGIAPVKQGGGAVHPLSHNVCISHPSPATICSFDTGVTRLKSTGNLRLWDTVRITLIVPLRPSDNLSAIHCWEELRWLKGPSILPPFNSAGVVPCILSSAR